MPVKAFQDAFLKLGENSELSIATLRIKSIALLSLALMLRPSDVAPKGMRVDENLQVLKMEFKMNQLQFNDDGSLTVWLHGIKNDASRDGFQVCIPKGDIPKTDPISALKAYISRTSNFRAVDGPVFISLNKPYRAISSVTVAKDLEAAIRIAGIDNKKYSAKCFRPTGATTAIEAGCDPENVRSVGRWKNREVFQEHYVYPRVNKEFTDKITGVKI